MKTFDFVLSTGQFSGTDEHSIMIISGVLTHQLVKGQI